MKEKQETAFAGIDVSKDTLAIVIAEDGRNGEVRESGSIASTPAAVHRFRNKLRTRFCHVQVCYEAGDWPWSLSPGDILRL